MMHDTTVLIAVDGSEASVRAARVASALFGTDATYTCAHVATAVPLSPPPSLTVTAMPTLTGATGVAPPANARVDTPADELDAAKSSATDIARQIAAEAGLEHAECVGLLGEPAEAVVRLADDVGAAVIVVGSHDRGWFAKLLAPSVADGIRTRSTVPVLVVPTGDD